MVLIMAACSSKEVKQEAPKEAHESQTQPQTSKEPEKPRDESVEQPEEPQIPQDMPLTRLEFLRTAMLPVGSTMYVYGGGWNEEDTAAGEEAVTIGISPRWKEFFEKQDASYDDLKTEYQIHDGLDCSAYIGWAVYNVLQKENGKEGYVYPSRALADKYEELGLGQTVPIEESELKPGDIISMKDHAWICLGEMEDGSYLVLHASPPGVMINGTKGWDGGYSQAIQLAENTMRTHYPEWFKKYPNCSRGTSYISGAVGAFSWDPKIMQDPEGICGLHADKIVMLLYMKDTGNKKLNSLCDTVLAQILEPTMTDREKAYAIYCWVEESIRYSGHTKMDGWQNGAFRALTTMKGNCYAYYSASAALLTRAGIENMEIHEPDMSHVWNLVKMDGEWYHFDATPGWGEQRFLWTDEQMENYSYYNEDVEHEISYDWDHAEFPATP